MQGPQILLTQQGAADNKTATPDTAALVLSGLAPTVLTPRLATVGKASLALTTFAPTVSAPQVVTPATATLSLTRFAPSVSSPRLATVGTASLSLTAFAPTITTSTSTAVTVGTLSLVLTTFAPDIAGAEHAGHHAVGRSLVRLPRAAPRPLPQPVSVSPDRAALRLATYPPEVAVNDDDLALILAA